MERAACPGVFFARVLHRIDPLCSLLHRCSRQSQAYVGLHPVRGKSDAGDHKGPPLGINLSPEARQEAGWSVGARADDVGKGGPLWSPGAGGVSAFPLYVSTGNRTRATIKALPATPHLPRPY